MAIEQFLTPKQVAGLLGLDITTVSRWVRSGRFPGAVRLSSRAVRIPEGEVKSMLQGARVFSGVSNV